MRAGGLLMLASGLLVGVAIALTGCDSGAVKPDAARKPRLAAPLIEITKVPFPCPTGRKSRTTIDIEACAANARNRVDAEINVVVRRVFAALTAIDRRTKRFGQAARFGSARVRFIDAERDWQAWAKADCSSFGDLYSGGTLSGTVSADCDRRRSRQHLREVRTLGCLFEYGHADPRGQARCLRRIPRTAIDPYASG